MRRINVILLDEQDKILREFQETQHIRCLDEALNKILLEVKKTMEAKDGQVQ